jgi:hypothetical protein
LSLARTTDALSFDASNVRVYRRAGSPSQWFDASFLFMGAEFNGFRQFFMYDAGMGANWYSAGWLDTLLGTGYVGRFAETPKITQTGLLFNVTASIEIQTAGLASTPVGGDWNIGVVLESELPTDGMIFHWSAASEPTGDGPYVNPLSSFHDAGASSMSPTGTSSRMYTASGIRYLQSITDSGGYTAANGPVRARNHNYTVAVCMSPQTVFGAIKLGPLSLNITSSLFELYGANNNALTLSGSASYVLSGSGRAVAILTMQRKGRAKVAHNGATVIDVATDVTVNNPFWIVYGRWHQVVAWDRVLLASELSAVNSVLMNGWAV